MRHTSGRVFGIPKLAVEFSLGTRLLQYLQKHVGAELVVVPFEALLEIFFYRVERYVSEIAVLTHQRLQVFL